MKSVKAAMFMLGVGAAGAALAVSACAPELPSPTVEMPPPVQLASVGGETSAFDGTYTGVSVENLGNLWEGSTLNCPNYADVPPVTIVNGVAQFQPRNMTFQGSVKPQGALAMRIGDGQWFQGQIDNQYVLTALVHGGTCGYRFSWRRSV